MTTALRAYDLRKIYPKQSEYALGDEAEGVSFEIAEGELFALLGPSGCGKTTTLRIIGGFVEATTGDVEIDGRRVGNAPPYARPTNTVFQNYALFPHMTVGGNVGFGLAMEKVGRAERKRRVAEALEQVGLGGMDRRRVTELSGGQAQRAALARAIVKRPSVLLLDEPLGALDLRLRKQMQDELVQLKSSTTTTFVHVTHDQEEACAIADRIAIMERGKIVQIDTPLALYSRPRTAYVARFIDAGSIVRGTTRRNSGQLEVEHSGFTVRGPAPAYLNGGPVAAVLPPHRVQMAAGEDPRPHAVVGTVDRTVFTGSVVEIYMRVGEDLELRASTTVDKLELSGEDISRGKVVTMWWRPEDVIFVEDHDEGAPLAEEAVTQGPGD
jgi:spermidine/putrescine transport system ATP-binding protein